MAEGLVGGEGLGHAVAEGLGGGGEVELGEAVVLGEAMVLGLGQGLGLAHADRLEGTGCIWVGVGEGELGHGLEHGLGRELGRDGAEELVLGRGCPCELESGLGRAGEQQLCGELGRPRGHGLGRGLGRVEVQGMGRRMELGRALERGLVPSLGMVQAWALELQRGSLWVHGLDGDVGLGH